MLVHLFILFHIIHSATCLVTCYVCPIDTNKFNYFVTADQIPEALNDCTFQTTGDNCFIDLVWHQNPNISEIAMTTRDPERSIVNEHSLYTTVGLESKTSNTVWTRSISYTCSTDRCNSLAELKRVLNALNLTDSLDDLIYLLKKEDPFDGSWCLFDKNSTSLECADSIPPKSCKLCYFQGMSRPKSIEFCSTCLQDSIGETFLSHEVDFDMTDRTRTDHWILACQSKNCNTVNEGALIRSKSISNFDFREFLGSTGNSNIVPSVNMILLLCILFLRKIIY